MRPIARYLGRSRSFTAFFVSPVKRSKCAPTPHLEQIDQTKNQHAHLFIHVFIYLLIGMETAFLPPIDCPTVAVIKSLFCFVCSREFSLLFFFFFFPSAVWSSSDKGILAGIKSAIVPPD